MDGLGLGMAAVALVLVAVWAVARQGERAAPVSHRTTPMLRRLGVILIVIGAASLVFAAVLLIGGEPGRSVWYGVLGAIEIASGRAVRRDDAAAD